MPVALGESLYSKYQLNDYLHADAVDVVQADVAMVRIPPLPGKPHLDERLIQERPEFIECDKITGDDPFLVRLVVHSIEQMDDVLEALSEHAVTSTAVIRGTSVKRRLPPSLDRCS